MYSNETFAHLTTAPLPFNSWPQQEQKLQDQTQPQHQGTAEAPHQHATLPLGGGPMPSAQTGLLLCSGCATLSLRPGPPGTQPPGSCSLPLSKVRPPRGLSKPLESTWPARKWDSLARTPRGTVRGRHPSLQGLTSGAHAGGIICLYCHLGVHTVPRSEPPPQEDLEGGAESYPFLSSPPQGASSWDVDPFQGRCLRGAPSSSLLGH